ncbi:c8c32074-cc61-4625-aa94-bac75215e161 [Sclerotinia trifoliorum]|uniref:C8c32074-cc61-4625-aa94-bac75215e161 n=1 Tax=Sclerotinia trifoliorum TaxID=28548 RepID=A0A8H2VXH2_9HELO|nr:c8c32074-cc61-4625-aa94-bac75215e161 [Sclerotinia trifoliorum]
MAKKKNKSESNGDSPETQIPADSAPLPASATSMPKAKNPKSAQQPSTSALIICRNKHWRYISSFHGPWLQLPPEVLEALANNNYALPRPRPVDPAVFFDILKIRQLVDDATNLAVRAASGVTSSSLSNSLNAGNGLLGNGGTALGLGIGGGGGNAKLSKERKHRMREQATQKLSKAYHLDEIACSVATMQSASTLEDVAQLVLQRNPNDSDAKYVHFFHEKIPSRQLAECTSLQPLDEVIADRPSEGEILRTRAVTKIFKEDFVGAAQDLTSALQVCRYYQNQHKAGRQQIQLASEAAAEAQRKHSGRWRDEFKLDEEDHPSSLETQLLFHRAGVYLTIACQHVDAALSNTPSHGDLISWEDIDKAMKSPWPSNDDSSNGEKTNGKTNGTHHAANEAPEITSAEKEAHRKRMESRKIVKTNAKRALRDYVAYLSHLDYTPGLPAEITEEFVRKVNLAANGYKIPRQPQTNHNKKGLDLESNASLSNGQLSDALVPHAGHNGKSRPQSSTSRPHDLPSLPPPKVYQISSLFSATPPADLPPYPETATALTTKQQLRASHSEAAQHILAQTDCHEALTYHPLLTDALHSLLLCHCLVQTSTRELQRHAHMVARLARVCDGYPVFQASRSPSRADWIEVIRRNDNWISLAASWETLCAPAPLPGQAPSNQQKETAAEKKERLKQQAIMEALEDDRVHDEASFHAAVAARQRRQEEEARKAEGRELPKRWAQEDGKEYPISTDRAQAIVRWIREAPVGGDGTGLKKKKKGVRGKGKGSLIRTEAGLQDIKIDGETEGNEEFERIEEEVD